MHQKLASSQKGDYGQFHTRTIKTAGGGNAAEVSARVFFLVLFHSANEIYARDKFSWGAKFTEGSSWLLVAA